MKPAVRNFRWIPRILAILAILFICSFALDSFGSGESLWTEISRFTMHLLPGIILLAFLLVAWKRELIGGIMFVIVGLGFIPLVYTMNYTMNQSVWTSIGVVMAVNLPFIVVGALFILGYYLQKKNPD